MPPSCSNSGRAGCVLAIAIAVLLAAGHAAATQSDDVFLLPTVLLTQGSPAEPPVLRRPDAADGREIMQWARQIDLTMSESVQDLGLVLDVSMRARVTPSELTDDGLVTKAQKSWVVSPRLEMVNDRLRLRIVAVPPGSTVLLVRTQEVDARELELRAMVMLRDLVQTGRGSPEKIRPDALAPSDERAIVHQARSAGRPVLALNAAAFGGYVGFAIQRASGSTDARLTYPLIALGTGIGLGGSMIVADEWDVGLGDAWYLSAGAWWPAAAGLLLAHGYDVEPEGDRFVYGLLGATAGIALATTALTFEGMGEGGAVLTHSGGAFGLLLGGMTELAYKGKTDFTPTRGMGYGAGAGVLASGVLATQLKVTASRVMLIDLGASLGALTGAAAASPLLIVEEETSKGRNRAWLASIAAGTLIGGGISWFVTRHTPSKQGSEQDLPVLPELGVVSEITDAKGRVVPVLGGGVRGIW